jgi:hypothetical protein
MKSSFLPKTGRRVAPHSRERYALNAKCSFSQ